MPRDNVLLHRAYAYAQAGDVLIVNCSGFYEASYWGDLMSLGAKTKGVNGFVIDACVRDADHEFLCRNLYKANRKQSKTAEYPHFGHFINK